MHVSIPNVPVSPRHLGLQQRSSRVQWYPAAVTANNHNKAKEHDTDAQNIEGQHKAHFEHKKKGKMKEKNKACEICDDNETVYLRHRF